MYQDNRYRSSITLERRNVMPRSGEDGRLKVAIVLMHFNYGGGERMVSLLASHLDLSRFDVRVFCVYGDPQDNVMERAVLDHGVPITYIRKGLGFSPKYLAKTWCELSKFKPDIVHTHLNACMYCAPWVMVHRAKLLHTIHNVPEKEAAGFRRKLMGYLYRIGKAVPVAISERNRELTAQFYGLSPKKVEMVVNPVDLGAFKDDLRIPWENRTYDFINVARFEPQKNQTGLIKAFSRFIRDGHPDSKLAIVGDGSLRLSCEQLTRELGIACNVDFLGKRDDIAALMQDSKCFILPSDYEGLPMTILEAMAAGLPVLATSVGGVPDVVEDGVTGLLVPAGDEDALVAAMERMVLSDACLESMSREADSIVSSYDCEQVAGGYSALYERHGHR